ncbi:MAG: CarD family transcriptional regulator [Bilifractor sp.]|jgi:CarD family transcriptional regulator
MFKKDSYVVYGMNGPCKIVNITTLDLPGCDRKRKYYVLQPVNSGGSTIYSPVDNEKVGIRAVISRKEAERLLGEVGEISGFKVTSEKFREDTYKEILRDSDCRKAVSLIRTLMNRRQKRLEQGRKFTSVDERYLSAAMSKLCSELAIALGREEEEIEDELIDLLHISA